MGVSGFIPEYSESTPTCSLRTNCVYNKSDNNIRILYSDLTLPPTVFDGLIHTEMDVFGTQETRLSSKQSKTWENFICNCILTCINK